MLAPRWYLYRALSGPDVGELLAEHGLAADHVTGYRCARWFIPPSTEAARPCR
ncbi:hypothetical protein [Frankia sp. Cj3]|uniref:hypothetical protein n=1 Tax=unclassified Frankia TaxID=2632575 RepID=UPI00351D2F28